MGHSDDRIGVQTRLQQGDIGSRTREFAKWGEPPQATRSACGEALEM